MSTHTERFDGVALEGIKDAVKKEEGLETKGPFILCCQAEMPKRDTCFTGKQKGAKE